MYSIWIFKWEDPNSLDQAEWIRRNNPDDEVILLGDLNLPCIEWTNDALIFEKSTYVIPMQRETAALLRNACSFLDPHQIYPAHRKKWYALDSLFSTSSGLRDMDIQESLLRDGEHHESCFSELNTAAEVNTNHDSMPQCNSIKVEYRWINEILGGVAWSQLFENKDVKYCATSFYSVVNDLTCSMYPLDKLTPSSISNDIMMRLYCYFARRKNYTVSGKSVNLKVTI